jgi:urea carboxylase
MCIYGMEGPGGYQLFGRTIQVWNTWRQTPEFAKGKPWLLNFFDQIRFFPVSNAELTEARAAFPYGGYPVRIEETEFSYARYETELQANAESIATFKNRQQSAFEAEKLRWKEEGLDTFIADDGGDAAPYGDVPAGCFGVASAVPGSIWKMLVEPGAKVAAGDSLAIVESMKMEISITTHAAGRVKELRAAPGRNIKAGDIIVVLEED